jgi:hypothetical protein
MNPSALLVTLNGVPAFTTPDPVAIRSDLDASHSTFVPA